MTSNSKVQQQAHDEKSILLSIRYHWILPTQPPYGERTGLCLYFRIRNREERRTQRLALRLEHRPEHMALHRSGTHVLTKRICQRTAR